MLLGAHLRCWSARSVPGADPGRPSLSYPGRVNMGSREGVNSPVLQEAHLAGCACITQTLRVAAAPSCGLFPPSRLCLSCCHRGLSGEPCQCREGQAKAAAGSVLSSPRSRKCAASSRPAGHRPTVWALLSPWPVLPTSSAVSPKSTRSGSHPLTSESHAIT